MKIFISLLLLMTLGCSAEEKLPTVELKVGEENYTLEVARTQEARRRGLMDRDSIGTHEGMLFVFERDQHLSFWMKDTYIPLSIAYISKGGVIKSIHKMEPESLKSIESNYAVRFALELPRGAFARSGVKVGDTIDGLDHFID